MSSPIDGRHEASKRPDYLWLFSAVLLLYCLWVLSLPLFPAQDGPVHLYLASIFKGLLTHTATTYPQYYRIGHYLPPYSVHYYLLVELMQFVKPLLAEKVFVCLILISFAFGLRYLMTALGENGVVFSLFGLCLLLNWSLSMGFESYVFSLSLGFWALGVWARIRFAPAIGLRCAFVGLLAVMSLTHSVPVAAVLGFTALDLGIQLLYLRRTRSTTARTTYLLRDLATLAISSLLLVYMSAFTQKRRDTEPIRHSIHPLAEMRSFYGHLEGVRFFNGPDWPTLFYKGSIYALLLIAAVIAFTGRKRDSSIVRGWRVAFILFVLFMPIVPLDINGGYVFAARLVILGWIAAFAAASGTTRLAPRAEAALVVFAIATSFGILWLAHRDVSREARQIAELTKIPVALQNKRGLILPGLEEHIAPANDYGVDTYVWAGAHYFREGRDVLMNTPWMDIPILPVNSRPELGINDFEPKTIEFFYDLRSQIEKKNPIALRLLSRADFILFSTGGQPVNAQAVDRILQIEPQQWSCSTTTSWTEICQRTSRATAGE